MNSLSYLESLANWDMNKNWLEPETNKTSPFRFIKRDSCFLDSRLNELFLKAIINIDSDFTKTGKLTLSNNLTHLIAFLDKVVVALKEIQHSEPNLYLKALGITEKWEEIINQKYFRITFKNQKILYVDEESLTNLRLFSGYFNHMNSWNFIEKVKHQIVLQDFEIDIFFLLFDYFKNYEITPKVFEKNNILLLLEYLDYFDMEGVRDLHFSALKKRLSVQIKLYQNLKTKEETKKKIYQEIQSLLIASIKIKNDLVYKEILKNLIKIHDKTLILEDLELSDSNMNLINSLFTLKKLSLAKSTFNFNCLDFSSFLFGVDELSLDGCKSIKDENLIDLKNVKNLSLNDTNITGTCFLMWEDTQLETLSLKNCKNLKLFTIKYLEKLNLKSVSLEGCDQFQKTELEYLKKICRLNVL